MYNLLASRGKSFGKGVKGHIHDWHCHRNFLTHANIVLKSWTIHFIANWVGCREHPFFSNIRYWRNWKILDWYEKGYYHFYFYYLLVFACNTSVIKHWTLIFTLYHTGKVILWLYGCLQGICIDHAKCHNRFHPEFTSTMQNDTHILKRRTHVSILKNYVLAESFLYSISRNSAAVGRCCCLEQLNTYNNIYNNHLCCIHLAQGWADRFI